MMWPFLAPLNAIEREAVLAVTRRRRFAKGEFLFHEGDPSDSLHLVVSGQLAVRVTTPAGERATLNVLSAGDTVGELSLLPGRASDRRSATVVALSEVDTRVLGASAFHELCRTHPAVQSVLLDLLAQRVRSLSSLLLETMYDRLDRRLYRRLIDLARVYDGGVAAPAIPLTQEHLADMVGGTRASVNQVLQRLSTRGIIELGRGRVTVLDLDALTKEAAL